MTPVISGVSNWPRAVLVCIVFFVTSGAVKHMTCDEIVLKRGISGLQQMMGSRSI